MQKRYLARPEKGRLFAPFLCVLLACCFGCASASTSQEAPRDILFVGNSFTYYNNSLHKHFRSLVAASGSAESRRGNVRIMTISGGQLPEHRDGLIKRIADESWDVVVLQGHSLGPVSAATADAFRGSAREFAGMIRQSGAQPVFFMTWAYIGQPEMTAPLDEAYSSIGRELGAQVVPVGLAFAHVTRDRPGLALRIADAKHPTMAGTYLAACTFYAAFYHESPEGLAYTAGLDDEVAAYLQAVAWETVKEYGRRAQQ